MDYQLVLFASNSALFGSCSTNFGVLIRFKKIFGTCLHRLISFIKLLALEVYLYLFASSTALFGVFCALFGPCQAILGVPIRFKHFYRTCLQRFITLVLDIQLYLAPRQFDTLQGRWCGVGGWLDQTDNIPTSA